MKEVNIKLISAILVILGISILIWFGNDKDALVVVLSKKKDFNLKVEELIKQNEDKELVRNENFKDKFIYLEFQKDNECFSYFIDTVTGEEKDFFA